VPETGQGARLLPSIRGRVTHTLLVISWVWGVLIAAVVWQVVGHEVDELMDQGLRESAEVFHGVIGRLPIDAQRPGAVSEHTDYEEHLVWQLVDPRSGQVLVRSHRAPEIPIVRAHTAETTTSHDGQWRAVTLAMRHTPDRFLLVAQSMGERHDARQEVVLYTMLSALLLGGLAALALRVRMQQELQPLANFSRAVQAFDPMLPGTVPAGAGRAELLPMEDAVRDLGERLARRVRSERAFAAHAAHALRTPLAGMDVQLAMALKEAPEMLRPRLVHMRQASMRLTRVVQALLSMFRSGLGPQRQWVVLTDLLASLPTSGMQVVCEGEATCHADPDLLAAVLMNLLDNAQRHGARQVVLRLTRGHGLTRLEVCDDGAGCDNPTRERLRTALAQQDQDCAGLSGLGLALADLVVRAHGGRLALPDVTQGFVVSLCWPDGGQVSPSDTPISRAVTSNG
jgi:signal transduction histidine kinase